MVFTDFPILKITRRTSEQKPEDHWNHPRLAMENETWNDFFTDKKNRTWRQLKSRSSTLLLYQRHFFFSFERYVLHIIMVVYRCACLACPSTLPRWLIEFQFGIKRMNRTLHVFYENGQKRFFHIEIHKRGFGVTLLVACVKNGNKNDDFRLTLKKWFSVVGSRDIFVRCCKCEYHCFNRSSRIWWLYVHGNSNWLHCISRSESFILVSFWKTTNHLGKKPSFMTNVLEINVDWKRENAAATLSVTIWRCTSGEWYDLSLKFIQRFINRSLLTNRMRRARIWNLPIFRPEEDRRTCEEWKKCVS